MEQLIWQCFLDYGWHYVLLACGGILLIGIFKFFHLFDKIQKDNRKYIYAILSLVYSALSSAIYLIAMNKFEINAFLGSIGGLTVIIVLVYHIYENYGIRKLLQWLGNLALSIREKIKDKDKDKENTQSEETKETNNNELVKDNFLELEEFINFEPTSFSENKNNSDNSIIE